MYTPKILALRSIIIEISRTLKNLLENDNNQLQIKIKYKDRAKLNFEKYYMWIMRVQIQK